MNEPRLQHDYFDRDDGLAHCKTCGGAEGSLTTECQGFLMTDFEQDQVYAGSIDFLDGRWVSKNETPGTEAPRASTENPFPVANCEERLSEPEALSSTADKLQQKMRPFVLHTIDTVGDYERAKGWLRYEAIRNMDIRRFTELVNRNVAGENFDEMVDQILVEREGL